MTSRNRDYGTLSAHQKPTVGDTKMSVVGLDHIGWLLCDGRLLNVKDFYFLFSIIQYSFGGSGAQFNLPNPAGRVPGVIGSGAGLTPRALAASVGEETHVLTIPEMPTHNHGVTDPGHTHSYFNQPNDVSPAVSLTTTAVADNVNVNQTTGSSTTGITIQNTGGSQAHNNMQPTLFMGNMYIYSGKPNVGTFPNTSYNYAAFPPSAITPTRVITGQNYSTTLIL